jgi:hypothetical protein
MDREEMDEFRREGRSITVGQGNYVLVILLSLSTLDPSLYENVDRRLLVIHSSIAELLHFTGAGQVIDRYLQDFEDTQVLSEDGSSVDILSMALSQLVSAC